MDVYSSKKKDNNSFVCQNIIKNPQAIVVKVYSVKWQYIKTFVSSAFKLCLLHTELCSICSEVI